MILNKLEFLLMNNPVRAFIQDKVEAKRLRTLSSLPAGKIVLEIGCGRGIGALLIQKYFAPQQYSGIDLDPRMISRARNNVVNPAVSFQVASATKLPFPAKKFDAIFDFAILHHLPNWKDGLQELKRVLKPGGEVLIEDLSMETFSTGIGKLYRQVLDHPYKNMYTENEFVDGLNANGFTIVHHKTSNPLGLLRHFVIIAKRSEV